MASTYSTNLALELIGTGDQAGTWGVTTNTNLGTLIEQAISGYVTQAITDGADTVITIPNGATGVARNMYIECTGALTNNRNLIVPANKKLYFIYNNTTGGYAVTVKVSGQTGVSVPNGSKMLLVCNGTDVVQSFTYVPTLNVGTLTWSGTASGGSLVPRVVQIADASSVTINGNVTDIAYQTNTQAAGTLTINAPSGTPVAGQKLIFRLQSTNVQTFSWNAIFQGSTDLALPSASTGSSKYDYLGFIYNAVNSKWQMVAKNFGF